MRKKPLGRIVLVKFTLLGKEQEEPNNEDFTPLISTPKLPSVKDTFIDRMEPSNKGPRPRNPSGQYPPCAVDGHPSPEVDDNWPAGA